MHCSKNGHPICKSKTDADLQWYAVLHRAAQKGGLCFNAHPMLWRNGKLNVLYHSHVSHVILSFALTLYLASSAYLLVTSGLRTIQFLFKT